LATVNLQKVKNELVVFLRNSDIFTTTQRGVTTQTDTFTATAGQTIFTLTKNVARNIRSVTVQSVSKSAYVDYTPSYSATSTTVTLNTGATLSDSVVIVYDYSAGTLEKIWDDYPEIKFLVNDAPRIGFDFLGFRSKVMGIGNSNWLNDAVITIKVYDKNLKNIDGYLTTIRSVIKSSQVSFYHFQLVYPTSIGPPMLHNIQSDTKLAGKIFEKSMDLFLRFNFES